MSASLKWGLLAFGGVLAFGSVFAYMLNSDNVKEQFNATQAADSQKSSKVKYTSFSGTKRGSTSTSELDIDGTIPENLYESLQNCRVDKVLTGDQFFCRDTITGKRYKFILYGVASPLADQSYGTIAKQALTEMLINQTVFYRVVGTDSFSRLESIVFVNGIEVNLRMVYAGNAFFNPNATELDNRYVQAQSEAQLNYHGLWNQHHWINNRPPENPFGT